MLNHIESFKRMIVFFLKFKFSIVWQTFTSVVKIIPRDHLVSLLARNLYFVVLG